MKYIFEICIYIYFLIITFALRFQLLWLLLPSLYVTIEIKKIIFKLCICTLSDIKYNIFPRGNLNKLSIKCQSYPELTKIDSSEEKCVWVIIYENIWYICKIC